MHKAGAVARGGGGGGGSRLNGGVDIITRCVIRIACKTNNRAGGDNRCN